MTPRHCKLTVTLLAVLFGAHSAGADEQPHAPVPAAPSLSQRHSDRLRDQQRLLSTLWVFASLNYLYCDVIGLMDANMLRQYERGSIDGITIDEDFLLGATIFMQVPLSMIVLSRVLPPRASRIANITAGALMTAAQTATLFIGTPTRYYAFSSGVEIATTGFITAYAAFAMKPPKVTPMVEARPDGFTVKAGFTF